MNGNSFLDFLWEKIYVNQPMLRRRMVRATIRPKAVAAAKPTTARIQIALEFPLNIEGLHDLKFPWQMIHLTVYTWL